MTKCIAEDRGLELSKVEIGTRSFPSLGNVAALYPHAPPRAKRRGIVELFWQDRRASKLSELHNDGMPSCSKFWTYRLNDHEKQTSKCPQLIQNPNPAKSEKIETAEQKASSLQEIHDEDLESLENHEFLDLVERELQRLEAEVELCSQDNAGLQERVRQEMERVIDEALRTIKHGGDVDITQAIAYNEELLNMHRKFEDLGCRLQKAIVDVASTKTVCVQMQCRCWWCRGCSSLQKQIPIFLNNLRIGNKHKRRKIRSSLL